jgi:spore coat polysaccharide biosynthesis protein SpsF (cytidylyltransferase family)
MIGSRPRVTIGGLITARTASTRLPGKALIEIAGVPLIVLLIERVRACRACSQVVLCTTTSSEDDELARTATGQGVPVYRGPNEAVAQRLAGAVHRFAFDHFARITGDNPLCAGPLLDMAITSHVQNDADYTSVSGVFVGGATEVISARAIQIIAERAVEPGNTEYLSWYLDNSELFRVNRLTADAAYGRPHRLTLDTAEDLEVMRALYDALYKPGIPVDGLRALDWLDTHPEIARINRDVRGKLDRRDLNLALHP